MHSSRMRTGRSLNVCGRLLPGGCLLRGCVCLVRGVCVCLFGRVSAPRGGVPGAGGFMLLEGVPGPGGCLVWGVCSGGGVPGQGGCLLWGVCLVRGVSALGGSGIPACTEADTLPPPDRITDACKNITLAQLRCGR